MDGNATAVLVADGDEAWRNKTAAVLERAGFATLEVETGYEALEAVRNDEIALALLEVTLPDMTGYEVCRDIRSERGERLPVFFLSGIRTEPLDRVAGLLLGADDFIVKPYDPAELVARVRRFISRAATHRGTVTTHRGPRLTPRETEVLRLLVEGRRQKEIAAQLVISQKTVATHIQNLLGKFGVHSRAELLAHAYRFGYGDSSAMDDVSLNAA